jgi:hypothetical protein
MGERRSGRAVFSFPAQQELRPPGYPSVKCAELDLLIVARLKSPTVQAREPANAGLPLVALVSLAAQGSIIEPTFGL